MKYQIKIKKHRGVVSIEFGLGSFALFFVLFIVFEVARLSYITNLTDTIITETSRHVRIHDAHTSSESYAHHLKSSFDDSHMIWNKISLVDKSQFHFTMWSCATLDMVAKGPSSGDCDKASDPNYERNPIVMYELTYDYHPIMFGNLLPSFPITRRILTIQEHEGWDDDDV
ncbi:TadE/TadG family type IV pilus assembly protein [Vibrio mediterranei]